MSSTDYHDRVIVITGPVGAGKTTTAIALSDFLTESQVPNAMIDLDHLRWAYPRPADDRFNSRVGMANLAAVAANYRAIGVGCFVLADVLETLEDYENYRRAIPDSVLTVARLRVAPGLIAERLHGRESEATIAWNLHRAVELEEIMERAGIGDLIVEVGVRTPKEVAAEIARCLGLIAS